MVQNTFFTIKLISNMSQTRLRSVMKIVQILMLMTHAVGNVHARWSRDTYGMYCCIIGNFYNLTKHLYCNKLLNMFCKNRRKQNSFFLILKEVFVKLGCILSPLLFNLYLNNLPCIYSKTHYLLHLFSQWNKTKFTIICR